MELSAPAFTAQGRSSSERLDLVGMKGMTATSASIPTSCGRKPADSRRGTVRSVRAAVSSARRMWDGPGSPQRGLRLPRAASPSSMAVPQPAFEAEEAKSNRNTMFVHYKSFENLCSAARPLGRSASPRAAGRRRRRGDARHAPPCQPPSSRACSSPSRISTRPMRLRSRSCCAMTERHGQAMVRSMRCPRWGEEQALERIRTGSPCPHGSVHASSCLTFSLVRTPACRNTEHGRRSLLSERDTSLVHQPLAGWSSLLIHQLLGGRVGMGMLLAVVIGGQLLEREELLAAVTDLVEGMRSGRGGALLVVGDAGLGKTTCLAQTAALAGPTVRVGVG